MHAGFTQNMSEGRFREKIRGKNLEFAMNAVAMFLSYSLSLRVETQGKIFKNCHFKGNFSK